MPSAIRRLLFGRIPSGHAAAIDWGLFILRVSVAAMMLFGHGLDKLVNFNEKAASFADPLGVGTALSLGLAVFAEFFCSILLGLGLFARLAAIPLCINMAVAAVVVHGDAPWAKKELAVFYLVVYVALLFTGPGRLSIDKIFARRD
jgi:putative oxidoreductase